MAKKPKGSRQVMFRVTDDSYARMTRAAKKHGFPSVSEYIRSRTRSENAAKVEKRVAPRRSAGRGLVPKPASK